MRIVFMGSDELACPSLRMLMARAQDELAAVITQPDRPKGRRRQPAPCPLKALAGQYAPLRILTPEKMNEPALLEELRALRPDIFVVVAYGGYIPQAVLKIAPKGGINLHPSLLPKYRGAAPVQQAIACGETVSGVTILYVAEELDAGDIILQEAMPIEDEDTGVTLFARAAEQGASLLGRALDLFERGEVSAVRQNPDQATYVTRLKKEDGRIVWEMPARQIRNRIRGFQPWPVCYFEWPKGSGLFVKVFKAALEQGTGQPGEVIDIQGEGPVVAAGESALRLLEVQPGGRSVMSGKSFLCGHAMRPGVILG
ncbi:MAG TPA: methionyl-tRNA formyltransferase [Kiritimatiellia bacterium]|nr:methionyl-tRNA formyltransferase [Kiritimatiellia bacterium]HNR93980.1 methionyl-tRNA formyltransferase [Kiritimatiellia bacterium]HPA77839.1 methionyl-tRNA formyltransferase [Kiritimatiellia bacterium]HQQ04496.1 methionyl-tRNA formyltransferase [Kiritimatiellia bacterium]